jgi:hypothetical protein
VASHASSTVQSPADDRSSGDISMAQWCWTVGAYSFDLEERHLQ